MPILKYYSKHNMPFEKATSGSAGIDIRYADESMERLVIRPKQTKLVHTGIYLDIPDGYYVELFIRSSLAKKREARLANSVGIIDSDYTEEVGVLIQNMSSVKDLVIEHGERIAQCILKKSVDYIPIRVYKKPADKGHGKGFGSTGRH